MSIVKKATDEVIKQVENRYAKYKIISNNKHVRSSFKLDQCIVSIFKSNKIMFQGKNEILEYNKIFKSYKKNCPKLPMIGSDEVGVGDYFGPLVVASAYIDNSNYMKIKNLGIKDSKKLSDSKIIEIANELEKLIPISIELFCNDQYNQLTNDGHNAHVLKAILHNKVHQNLESKYKGAFHVIDQFVAKNNYYKYFEKLNIKPLKNVYFETKAEDKYIAVACAAIVARKYFLKAIDEISLNLKIKIPLGAGKNVDKAIKLIRKIKGEDTLKAISKYNFANTIKTK